MDGERRGREGGRGRDGEGGREGVRERGSEGEEWMGERERGREGWMEGVRAKREQERPLLFLFLFSSQFGKNGSRARSGGVWKRASSRIGRQAVGRPEGIARGSMAA